MTNTEYFYLIEFGIHYNCSIDQMILSKWFRMPYFKKRLTEFPFINGRIAEPLLRKKWLMLIHLLMFPLLILRLIYIRFKIIYIRRSLRKTVELSAGMINLLNSSAFKLDFDYQS